MMLSLECNGCKATLTLGLKREKKTTAEKNDRVLEAMSDTANEARKDNHSYKKKKKHISKIARNQKETAILSSWSFTSDSAEYYGHPPSRKTKTAPPPPKRGTRGRGVIAGDDDDRVERGIAEELRSTDLYGDFWRSMVEMIAAKGKLRAGDMTQLLQCYLSLNSPEHHPVIVEAFSDVYCSLLQMTS